jgi:Eukaryotic aspartyl protease
MRLLAIAIAAVACTPPPASPTPPKGPIAIPLEGALGRYVGRFEIGNQSFGLAVDTGSELVAVASPACMQCGSDGTTAYYTPGKRAKPLQRQVRNAYDEGQIGWTGDAYLDTVGVDSVSAPTVVFAMTEESSMVVVADGVHADGLIGLAGDGVTNWLDGLARTNIPDEFALRKCETTGTMWVGDYDDAGSAVFVDSSLDYDVALQRIAIGSASIELPPNTRAVIDSGTAGLVLPRATYDAVVAALDRDPTFSGWFGSGAAWFDKATCEPVLLRHLLDRLPPITIELDGVSITLPAAESYAMPWGDEVCPTLATRDDFVLLGDLPMRSNVVVFDRSGRRIGFAPPTSCTE